jgi:hypothetical protein
MAEVFVQQQSMNPPLCFEHEAYQTFTDIIILVD